MGAIIDGVEETELQTKRREVHYTCYFAKEVADAKRMINITPGQMETLHPGYLARKAKADKQKARAEKRAQRPKWLRWL